MFRVSDVKKDGAGYRFRFRFPVTNKTHNRCAMAFETLNETRKPPLAEMMSGEYQARVRAQVEKEVSLATSLGTVLRDYVKEREADCARGDIQQSHLGHIFTMVRRSWPLHEVDVANLTDNHFQDVIDGLKVRRGLATPRAASVCDGVLTPAKKAAPQRLHEKRIWAPQDRSDTQKGFVGTRAEGSAEGHKSRSRAMAHHDCLYGHHGPQIGRGSRFGWEAVD